MEELERQEIICKIKEPTSWCASMVVVPRKNESVRIYVEYTKLNKSVKLQCLLLPDVSEALAQIKPQSQYHILLDRDLQLLTTFITSLGIFVFRRLPIGIMAAIERFQKEMSETLVGLEGIVNVADDTLIFEKTKQKHNDRLHKVLAPIKEKSLRLNKEKMNIRRKATHISGIHHFASRGTTRSRKRCWLPKIKVELENWWDAYKFMRNFCRI